MVRSKKVSRKEMTPEKQLGRAKELYGDKVTPLTLKDVILMADAEKTRYIIYGLMPNYHGGGLGNGYR